MGTLEKIGRILKPPKLSDLTDAPRKFKESSQRSKMNLIDVFYLDRDFQACDIVVGEIVRKTKISIVSLKAPEPLAFFKVKGSTIFNRTTGKNMMLCVEGYPYGLQLDRELIDEERNMTASDEIKNGIQLPVLLDKLPYYVEKRKSDEQLRELSEDNYFELTPSLLEDLGNVKLTDGVTEENNSVIPVTLGIGILIGMVLMMALSMFATGG